MTQIQLPLRSVSQLNQYVRCPMAYKLARRDKVWARPAAWLPQGSAVHTVLEHVELANQAGTPMSLEEAKELFKEQYSTEVSRYTETTPNMDWWFWSGPYSGMVDIERRYEIGLEQVEKFYSWRADKGQEIWITPDGKPAIELAFKIKLGGDESCPVHYRGIEDDDCDCGDQLPIVVRGFIDAVVVVDGKPHVRDYKTGNTPGDDFQLAVYALAISMEHGIEMPRYGDYYMAGKKGKPGKPTHPYDLSDWTKESITERFHEVEKGIAAEEFPALPESDKCNFCDVNYSCPEFNH
ncbi:Cas4 exonuclease [Gordonia phage Anon]|nr:Cas4 exonuclease [Gordonia phage Anon]